MEGLLGNPVIQGLLGGAGPMGVRAQSQQQMAAMTPRAAGGRLGAPSAPAPDRSGAAAIASFGESAAKAIQGYAAKQQKEEQFAAETKMYQNWAATLSPEMQAKVKPLIGSVAGHNVLGPIVGDRLKPSERRIIKGADGQDYYEDTKEPVLPGVKAPVEPPKTREINQGGNLVTQEWDGTKWATVAQAPRFQPPAATRERYTLYKNGKAQEVGVGTKTEQVLLNAGWSLDPVAERNPPKTIETATGIYELTPDGLGRKIADAPPEPQDDLARAKLDDRNQAKRTQSINSYEDISTTIRQAELVLNHPGREAGTGLSSWQTIVPGSDAKGFAAQLETLKAQVFLPQVEKMKGNGSLSDAEGKKLSAAFAALDPNMPEEEFKRSLETAISDLQRAQERARAKLPADYSDPFAMSSGGNGNAPELNVLIDKYAGEQ